TVHELSPRRGKSFIPINCAAIPETLIESEVFGHEKGAFTGALERRIGCFELAEGGTLLLDEIGEMPIATQAKLLRVLEDRKLRRLGSKVETTVDVRVLAATNKVPEEAVAHGELRNDLYYRLNVFNIHMPLLREHREDIPELVQSVLADMNLKHGRKVAGVSEAVLNLFRNYSWQGNVRELRNTLERAVIVCDGPVVETKHLPPNFGQTAIRTSAEDPDAVRLGVGTTVAQAASSLHHAPENYYRACHHLYGGDTGVRFFLYLYLSITAAKSRDRARDRRLPGYATRLSGLERSSGPDQHTRRHQ